MHTKFLTSAALLGLIAGSAAAQTQPAPATAAPPPPAATAPAPQVMPPHQAARHAEARPAVAHHALAMRRGDDAWGTGTEPFSTAASNIVPADTSSVVAPRLPTPPVGANADPERLLAVAEDALRKDRTGLAQEALERAETRLLNRATLPSALHQPDTAPRIEDIAAARQALGTDNLPRADQLTTQAMSLSGRGTGS